MKADGGLLSYRAAGDRLGAQFGNVAEQAVLVGGIALDGFDQVGDQIGAAAQLHVDAAPALRHEVLVADQAIVSPDQITTDNNNKTQEAVAEHQVAPSSVNHNYRGSGRRKQAPFCVSLRGAAVMVSYRHDVFID